MRKIKKMIARSILFYIEELKKKVLECENPSEALLMNDRIVNLINAIKDL